jgi:hypothetical protein
MKLHAVRAYFTSTPQLASPQQTLIAGALYSHFHSGSKPVVPDLAKSDHLLPCGRAAESPSGIKQMRVQSPD